MLISIGGWWSGRGAGVWGVRCPLTPDPSPPAGARGDLVFSFQFLVFSLAGQFVALREALRWLGGERSGSGRRSGTVLKNPCFAGFLTRFRVPGC